MVNEKSKKNLISIGDRPPEKQLEIRRMGQKAQKAVEREKKTIKKCLMILRDTPMPAEKCQEMGLPEGTTYAIGVATSLMNGTLDKNPAMAKLLLEALGEIKNEINVTGSMPVVIHDDID